MHIFSKCDIQEAPTKSHRDQTSVKFIKLTEGESAQALSWMSIS